MHGAKPSPTGYLALSLEQRQDRYRAAAGRIGRPASLFHGCWARTNILCANLFEFGFWLSFFMPGLACTFGGC